MLNSMLVNDCIDSDGIALCIRPREHSSIPVDILVSTFACHNILSVIVCYLALNAAGA